MPLHIVTTNESSYYCIDLKLGNLGATRQWFSFTFYILFRRENNYIYGMRKSFFFGWLLEI